MRHFKDYQPDTFVLPDPTPRNIIWMAKNEWFEKEVLPPLSASVHKAILI